jgi:hypothetical protein
MDRNKLEIIELMDELLAIKKTHTETVIDREKLEAQDPEDERYMRYDEDLAAYEYDIDEIASRIEDLVAQLKQTREW